MTLIPTAGDFWWPMPEIPSNGNPPAFASLGTNSTGTRRSAVIIRAPVAGTLHSFEFMSGTYSGTNTPRISFQDVDPATGDPDGVVDQFRTVTGASTSWIVPPGVVSSDGTDTGTKRVVAAGELLACVLDFSAYTSGQFGMQAIGRSLTNRVFPYHSTFDGAVWTKPAVGSFQGIALRYTDPSAGYIRVPETLLTTGINTNTFNNGSSPDEYAAVFVVPFKCTIDGAWVYVDWDENTDVVLYNNAGTAVATVTLDKDVRETTSTGFVEVSFAPQSVAAGDTLRLAVRPATSTNITIYTRTIPAGVSAATYGGANSQWQSTRTDGGAWSVPSSTIKMFAGLHIAQIDDGAGPGGISRSRVFLGM